MASPTLLPWEIIVDIFCRLPVKDLLRYRSVSKSWCSLIDGRDFIKLHLHHSVKTSSNAGVVFGGRNDLCWVDLDDLDSPARLTHPIDIGTGVDVVGSCNGLLALMNSNRDMAIWNPSTRKYVTLPISEHTHSFPFHRLEIAFAGLGHDPVADDYKFLLVINFCGTIGDSFHYEVKVYSLKAKTWRKIDHFPDHIFFPRGNGVPFGNALHWVVFLKSDASISVFALDLVTEDYREMGLPRYKGTGKCGGMRLANLGGRFCAVMVPNFEPELKNSERVDVWLMKEYGVKESWTKLFSVSSNVTGPFTYLIPVAYLKSGDQVLLNQDGEKLIVYDMKRKKVKNTRAGSGFPKICDAVFCVRSLVGVDGGESTRKNPGTNNNIKGRKQNSKKRDDFLSKGFKLVL